MGFQVFFQSSVDSNNTHTRSEHLGSDRDANTMRSGKIFAFN